MNLKQKAIDLIAIIERRDKDYDIVNKQLRELQGDFASHVEIMDTEVNTAVVGLLDAILDKDDTASYYLYECLHMKDGGSVTEHDGTHWPLRNIEDLTKYVFRT